MSEKRYPATETRLRKLRQEGWFPRSRLLSLAGVGVGMCLTFELARRGVVYLVSKLQLLLSITEPTVALTILAPQLFLWIALPTITIACCRICFGLAQTRGGMWWSRVGIRLTRLFPSVAGDGGADYWRVRGIYKTIGKLVSIGVLIWVWALVVRWQAESWFGSRGGKLFEAALLPNAESIVEIGQDGLDFLLMLISGPLYALSMVLLSLGLTGYLLSILLFRREQRLTREELEAEAREQDGDDFRRRALAELRSGE